MLSKDNRLLKNKDFQAVFRKGEGFKKKFLVLKRKPNSLNKSRVGFIVGLKVSKKATQRNRIKRALRQAVKEKLTQIKKPQDIILIALPGLEKKNPREIKETVDSLFKKAKIISNKND